MAQIFPKETNSTAKTKNDEQPLFENVQDTISPQIQQYVDEKMKLYENLLLYLENQEIDLVEIVNQQENLEKTEDLLRLLVEIANNHHQSNLLFQRIFQILQYYQDQIKQHLSDSEIFDIFQNNKKLLLFLFENKIITVNNHICMELINKFEANGNCYCHFFYPEIKEFAGEAKSKYIEEELLAKDADIFDHLDEKRREGENDSYICSLIRKDSVEEFVSYVNRRNISLESEITPSLFETNRFLIENKPSLIEYSAFFGSIQIFQYLRMNNVKLTKSLWIYAIHSKNAELIHLLESYNVDPPGKTYDSCYLESIKCHHNSIAEYFKDNLMQGDKSDLTNKERVISYALKYRNYAYFPSDFNEEYEFYYLCSYKYQTLVDLFIKKKRKYESSLKKASMQNKTSDVYCLLLKENKIHYEFFRKSKNLTRIVIPSSVTSIESKAFERCTSLVQVVIPSSVISIGRGAFERCSSLEQVIISLSVTSIEDNTFFGCLSLAKIEIPYSVTSIGNNAFDGCSSLKCVEIPSLVKSIGNNAFYGCISLSQIVIPSSVTSFGDNIFNGIKSLEIKGDIKCIPSNLFKLCTSLTYIKIPPSVKKIEKKAFYNCSSLMQIEMPSSLPSIGYCAFYGCSPLLQPMNS